MRSHRCRAAGNGLIEKLAEQFTVLQLAATFDDTLSGAEFLRANKIDLLLTDIIMPVINGLELVKNLDYKPMNIFITAHK